MTERGAVMAVVSSKDKAVLYEDFADVFHDPKEVPRLPKTASLGHKNLCGYNPRRAQGKKFHQQTFHMYGKREMINEKLIFFHARKRTHRSDDNYRHNQELINALRAEGYQVATLGLSSATEDCDCDYDFRDVPLKKLVDLMADGNMIVGTSSGPLHLAALCGLPQVAISEHVNLRRYKTDWNPFQVPATCTGNWHSSVDNVVDVVFEMDRLCRGWRAHAR
jgi:ADP-heptose:LPS heptosyltransferase